MNRVSDPEELVEVFSRDRETHVYGLADLEEPYWSRSSWYRRESAVVGLVDAGDGWTTGYAMSRHTPAATLKLLADLVAGIPPGTWITGPTGMFELVSDLRSTRDIGVHWRMILGEPPRIDGSQRVVALDPNDLDSLTELHASDPGQSFFLPGMLERNTFVGVWEDERLVASAGTHVVSRRFGVVALGAVITRPSHRGRGLGRLATTVLCRQLLDEGYQTIGLNVETGNEAALRLYEGIGFQRVFEYEEIEVL